MSYFGGKIFYVHCAHFLNLFFQGSLSAIKDANENVQESASI